MDRHAFPNDGETGSRTGPEAASRTVASRATTSREQLSGLHLKSALLEQLDDGPHLPWNLPSLEANMLLYHTQRLPQARRQNTYSLLAKQGHAGAGGEGWEQTGRSGPKAKKAGPSFLKDRSKVLDVLSSKQYLYETQKDSGGSDG